MAESDHLNCLNESHHQHVMQQCLCAGGGSGCSVGQPGAYWPTLTHSFLAGQCRLQPAHALHPPSTHPKAAAEEEVSLTALHCTRAAH